MTTKLVRLVATTIACALLAMVTPAASSATPLP
jgi:hypothetical protein